MDLDRHRIKIRERAYVDVLDLALRVTGQLAWPLVPLLAAGVLPLLLLNQWLLSGCEEADFETGVPWGHVLRMLVLIVFEAPLATAPVTLYLGQALFTERPRLRAVLRELGGSLPQLLIFQVLLRPLSFRWTYLNEVILLDRNPLWRKSPQGRTTASRARTVHRSEGGDLPTRSILSLGLAMMLIAGGWTSIGIVRSMLVGRMEWPLAMYTVYLPLSVWIVVGFFAVVRFLGYLDLRIRREGWEVELAMRAEGARLTRRWG